MIKLKSFTFNPFDENTFVLWSDQNKEGIVIDPGMSNGNEEKIFDDFIVSEEIILTTMLNTHCHIDHIFGCKYVNDKYSTEYLIPEDDLLLLEHYDKQMSMVGIAMDEPPKPDKLIKETDSITLNGSVIKPLLTPGHSPGEMCFYVKDENFCITGDVLFKGSIGRTDLWGSDTAKLFNSIATRLMVLDDSVVIYPGHGGKSTIGEEKRTNPFLLEMTN
ncbi:MAG TPA: MBL fold metallo-hydrolase [Ignavibacteria bacterium]|nr:MBL fold metallo-hydrolase [Ignavibacteria bacterium]